MKKTFSFLTLIALLMLIFLIQSCKDENTTEPQSNADEIKIAKNTKILNETDYTTYLKEISSDSATFTFYSSSNTKFDFKVNDVMCLAVGEGILRKITSVNKTADEVIVETTEASLADAIESGKVSFSEVLPEPLQKDLPKGIKYLGKRLFKDGKKTALTFSIERILFDEDNNTNTTDDQIKVTGNLELSSTLTGEIEFGYFNIERLELGYEFTEGTSINLEVGLINTSVNLFSYEFPPINFPPIIILVGSLPVIVTPQLNIETGSDIDIYAQLETGVEQEINYNVGLLYENESWSTFKEIDTTFNFIPPTINGGVTRKVFVTPDLQFKIYVIVSPNLEAELYGKAKAEISLPNPDLELDVFAGLNITGGVKMEVFDIAIIDYSYTFYEFEVPIYHQVFNGNNPPDPPTLSSPSNEATNVGLPSTLIWNASSGATSYTVQVSTSSSFTTFVYNQSGLTGTSQQVTGLNNSIKYYWQVSATNSYGTSGWSSVWTFTTEAGGTAPQPPTLSSPSNGATNVSLPPALVWNASSGATSYTLQVSTNSNYTSFVYNQGGLTGTSQQITGLNNSTQYYWRVSATSSYGTSGWSSVWNFTTAAGGTIIDGLIADYPFNGNANDNSDNGLNLTIEGNPTLVSDRHGNLNSAYQFDGTEDYLFHDRNELLIPLDKFTLNVWINNAGLDGEEDVIISTLDLPDIGGYQIYLSNNDDMIRFSVRNPNDYSVTTPYEGSYINGWVMITAIYDKNIGIKLFINGELKSELDGIIQINYTGTNNFRIGTNPHADLSNPADRRFKGKIDDVRIYDRVLEQSEINILFNQ